MHILVVVIVHDDDAVETLKVGLANLTGAVREFITTRRGGTTHARISQLARMTGISTGRIDFDLLRQTPTNHQIAQDALCGRRAADVAQADK